MSDDESKFVPPEALGQPNSPEQTQADFALTPEVEAKIMTKVQDIYTEGTAFTSVRDFLVNNSTTEKLRSIFRNGLLGGVGDVDVSDDYPEAELKKHWINSAKKREAVVFVNFLNSNRDLNELHWFSGRHTEIGLILDLKKYKEVMPQQWYGDWGGTFVGKSKSIRGDAFSLPALEKQLIMEAREMGLDPNATIQEFFDFVQQNKNRFQMDQKRIDNIIENYAKEGFYFDTEYGHVVTPRVAPRYIAGIVLRPIWDGTITQMPDDDDIFDKKLKMVVSAMSETAKSKSFSAVPIYDAHGNILWPKYMSYKSVKQFVAERDAKKAEETK